jgi:hypothetical protein
MADAKQLLLEALSNEFPAEIIDFLNVPIPTVPTAPEDVDNAIILTGQLSAYLIQIIQAFAGMPLLDVFLHAGQKNATLQAIALSGLEMAKEPKPHDFRIVSPIDGITVEEAVIPIEIEIVAGLSDFVGATARVDGKPPRALEVLDKPMGWGYDEEFPSGEHTVEITAVFKPDYWKVKTVSFTVDLPPP